VPPTLKLVIALPGGVIYAGSAPRVDECRLGRTQRNANEALPALGVGAAVVVLEFFSIRFMSDCVMSER
jgi:hypothetical protein